MDEALFKPHRLKTGLCEICEEDFILTFENKLGPVFMLKNLMREHEKEKDSGVMNERDFFELLATLSGAAHVPLEVR